MLGAGRTPSSLLPCIEQALRAGYVLRFEYRDREGRCSQRAVEPHGLLVQPPVWYILGVDVHKAAPRMFRMDRMSAVQLDRNGAFTPSAAVVRELTAELMAQASSNA